MVRYHQADQSKNNNMNNELTISSRGIEMPESPIRKLAPLAYAAEDEGVNTD